MKKNTVKAVSIKAIETPTIQSLTEKVAMFEATIAQQNGALALILAKLEVVKEQPQPAAIVPAVKAKPAKPTYQLKVKELPGKSVLFHGENWQIVHNAYKAKYPNRWMPIDGEGFRVGKTKQVSTERFIASMNK
jgi:hypothetical protein